MYEEGGEIGGTRILCRGPVLSPLGDDLLLPTDDWDRHGQAHLHAHLEVKLFFL